MTLKLRLRIIAILAALALSPMAHSDTDDEKLRVAQEMIDAWNALNWERVYTLFAKDGVLHSVMHEPSVGRDAIRKRLHYIEQGVERIELQITHMGVIDGVVFMERVDDFHFNGRHGRVPVVGVLEIDGGKIQEWREYYDRATLERAVAAE